MLGEAKDDTGGKCLQEGRVGGTRASLLGRTSRVRRSRYQERFDLSSTGLARIEGATPNLSPNKRPIVNKSRPKRSTSNRAR